MQYNNNYGDDNDLFSHEKYSIWAQVYNRSIHVSFAKFRYRLWFPNTEET